MKAYLRAYFDQLKTLVLNKSQITQLLPADCYRLALDIKAVTNKSVSETTIKRIFGFASSIHRPSAYTLNALAEYCGFSGWDDFYTNMEQCQLRLSPCRTWDEVSRNATKISLFNIESNKHKCGIPYRQTIDREHVDMFMQRFQQSEATAGIFSGPAGYGKTVSISRWLERKITQKPDSQEHDSYLFVSSLSLLHSTIFGFHSNKWLANLLGFDTTDLLESFMENYQDGAPGNFYLIIDELHSDLVTDKQFSNTIDQLSDMAQHFARFTWFRVILVMRTSTLFKYRNLFQDTIANLQWFSILSGTPAGESADMGAFSNAELHQLIRNINGRDKPLRPLNLRHKNLFHVPLFFQYYYELNGENADPREATVFDEYLVVARYLKKKVFNGVNSLGKQSLLDELAALVDAHDSILHVNKRQVYAVIKQHQAAYQDLLSIGVLQEINSKHEVRQQVTIRFQSERIATYFMALQWFHSYNDTGQLLDALDRSASSNKVKVDQLKWLLLFYIESGDLDLVNQIENIQFLNDDRFEIIAFICDGIHKLSFAPNQLIRDQINLELCNSAFVEYALSFTCFQPEYEPNVSKLLDFNLSETHEIILRSKLAFIAILKWEEDAFMMQFEQLAVKPPEAFASFVINPFVVLSYLYQYFKGEHVDKETIHELEMLYRRLSKSDGLIANQLFDLLVYTLAKVSRKIKFAHGYIDVLSRRLNEEAPRNAAELNFTKLIYALFLTECGEVETASAYASRLSTNYPNNFAYLVIYNIFLIQWKKLRREEDYHKLGRQTASICEVRGFRLLESYCWMLILDENPKDELPHLDPNLGLQSPIFDYTAGLSRCQQRRMG